MKKLVSFVLVLTMACSLLVGTAFAASTDYALTGGTATVDGTANQTVEVKFTSIAGGSYYSFSGDWAKKETQATSYLTLTALTAGGTASPTENSVDSGRTVWLDMSYSAPITVAANGAIWTATYTVDKDTPTGDYTVNLSVDGLTNTSYNADSGYTLTATISVTNNTPAAEGYTVTASASDADVETEDSVNVYLDVTHSDSEITSFNTVDMTLTYDPAKFTYASGDTVSGFAVDSTTSGSLHIQGYGEAVNIGDGHELTLAFTANATGTGSFALTSAKVDTAAHANADISNATVSGSPVSVTVSTPAVPTYTVSFNLNGHGGSTPPADIADVSSGNKISAPVTAPTDADYDFGGWYKEAGCTNAWSFTTDTVTDNITLYAKWTAKEPTATASIVAGYLDGYTLVKVTVAHAGATVPAYAGTPMYKVTNVESLTAYDANAYYYVVSGTVDAETAQSNVSLISGTTQTLNKTGDANQTTLVDINDAQFIYNLYNSSITVTYTPTAAQLLASDVNGDGAVDSFDCAAAVAAIA